MTIFSCDFGFPAIRARTLCGADQPEVWFTMDFEVAL